MADKEFNLFDECAAQCLHFIDLPGRRGASQMTPAEINKTSAITKVRNLLEQVIRRLKAFQIIANEMPIFLLSHVALFNFCLVTIFNFHLFIFSIKWNAEILR